jgi:ABC-type glycerol-3-phosphate transport system substrate-binding protein
MIFAITGLCACEDEEGTEPSVDVNIKDVDLENVQITFWNPITGPDAVYMQDLIKNFNQAYKGKIEVKGYKEYRSSGNRYRRLLVFCYLKFRNHVP